MSISNLLTSVSVWRRLLAVRLWTNCFSFAASSSSNLFDWFFIGLSAQRLNIFLGYHFSLKKLLLLALVTAYHYRSTVDPFANHLICRQFNVTFTALVNVFANTSDHNLWRQPLVINWRARILWHLLRLLNLGKMRTAFLPVHRLNLSDERLLLVLLQMWTRALLVGLFAVRVELLVLQVLLQGFLNCRLISIHLFVIIQRDLSKFG